MFAIFQAGLIVIGLVLNFSTIQSSVITYRTQLQYFTQQTVNLNKQHSMFAYRKFQALYLKLNVCSLYRVQKLELCNQFLSNRPFEFIFDDSAWANTSCVKMCVQFDENIRFPRDADFENKFIYSFKCPNAFRVELRTFNTPERQIVASSISYFLSSGPKIQSAIMYYRHDGIHGNIRPNRAVLELLSAPLVQVANTKKRLTVTTATKYQYSRIVETKPTRINVWEVPIARYPNVAEYKLQYFIKDIKENKSVYRKFALGLYRVNVCGLTTEQQTSLCKHSYENTVFGFKIRPSYDVSAACQRKKISFNYENSKSELLYLIQCHMSGPAPKDSYFLSQSSEANILIGYVRLNPHEEILPDGYIREVNTKNWKLDTTSPSKLIHLWD